jgi:hypothetical protein
MMAMLRSFMGAWAFGAYPRKEASFPDWIGVETGVRDFLPGLAWERNALAKNAPRQMPPREKSLSSKTGSP